MATTSSDLTPQHQTLLLKHSTHTILVSLLPTSPISDIKRSLLSALSSRNISQLSDLPVPKPDEVERVELGVAVDRKDYQKGFTLLRQADEDVEAGADGYSKGKGKAKVTTRKANGVAVNDTITGAGLRDGDVVAFRFKPTDSGVRSTKAAMADEDEDKDGEDEDMLDEDDEEDPGWNIKWPSYDDEE